MAYNDTKETIKIDFEKAKARLEKLRYSLSVTEETAVWQASIAALDYRRQHPNADEEEITLYINEKQQEYFNSPRLRTPNLPTEKLESLTDEQQQALNVLSLKAMCDYQSRYKKATPYELMATYYNTQTQILNAPDLDAKWPEYLRTAAHLNRQYDIHNQNNQLENQAFTRYNQLISANPEFDSDILYGYCTMQELMNTTQTLNNCLIQKNKHQNS